jgi:hypothetical protein
MTTLYHHLMFFRGFLIKKTNHAFLMREHIPMNITTKLGSNWPSGFGECPYTILFMKYLTYFEWFLHFQRYKGSTWGQQSQHLKLLF